MFEIFPLIGAFASIQLSHSNQEIVTSETPRPLSYEVEMRVSCGGKNYVVAIESQGRSSSRVVTSTLDGSSIEFRSATGDLSNAIGGMAVTEIMPRSCDERSGVISMSVGGYDPRLDGIEGETGEVTHTFRPHAVGSGRET